MSTFSITRTAHTSAPADRVLPLVHDFHAWESWSPWEGLDPKIRRTYTGPARGVGSTYEWSGNAKAGAGSMTMTRADERGAELDLVFTKPFKGANHVTLDVVPASDGGSDLTWTMAGEQGRFGRLMHRIMPMERMLGEQFDRGLAQLGAEAEKDAGTAAT